jgi:hypothetical protein
VREAAELCSIQHNRLANCAADLLEVTSRDCWVWMMLHGHVLNQVGRWQLWLQLLHGTHNAHEFLEQPRALTLQPSPCASC